MFPNNQSVGLRYEVKSSFEGFPFWRRSSGSNWVEQSHHQIHAKFHQYQYLSITARHTKAQRGRWTCYSAGRFSCRSHVPTNPASDYLPKCVGALCRPVGCFFFAVSVVITGGICGIVRATVPCSLPCPLCLCKFQFTVCRRDAIIHRHSQLPGCPLSISYTGHVGRLEDVLRAFE